MTFDKDQGGANRPKTSERAGATEKGQPKAAQQNAPGGQPGAGDGSGVAERADISSFVSQGQLPLAPADYIKEQEEINQLGQDKRSGSQQLLDVPQTEAGPKRVGFSLDVASSIQEQREEVAAMSQDGKDEQDIAAEVNSDYGQANS